MRLFLLPISTRRTLIYCERIAKEDTSQGAQRSLLDRATNKASETWASWEKKESGWQKRVVTLGNKVLRRIPFEEWGLKSIPPLTKAREEQWAKLRAGASAGGGGGEKEGLLQEGKKVEVLFPGLYLDEARVPSILQALATERQALHRRKLYWSLVGMPISAPFALVPVIPNIPFFYLAFRAYSHWKALSGSKHLAFLLANSALRPTPSAELDAGYTAGLANRTRDHSRSAPPPTRDESERVAELVKRQTNDGTEDVMLLQGWNGKLLAERFGLPEMEVEVERAVEQVESSIKAKEELLEEKREIETAVGRTSPPPPPLEPEPAAQGERQKQEHAGR